MHSYNREKINDFDNKENTKIIENKSDINNLLLLKINEKYINKINELERIIKELKIQLIEKDRLIREEKEKKDNLDKIIKEIKNEFNDKANIIIKLENEIKLFRSYYNFSSNEKLISIKFISGEQDIDFSVITKNTEAFSKIENMLYEKYPKYKDSENYFLVNGNRINRHRTLEENKVRNNEILTLEINNID